MGEAKMTLKCPVCGSLDCAFLNQLSKEDPEVTGQDCFAEGTQEEFTAAEEIRKSEPWQPDWSDPRLGGGGNYLSIHY